MDIVDRDFNKLVRDKIPQILKEEGVIVETRSLGGQEFEKELKKKLIEEAQEVIESERDHVLEELGDVETVIDGLLELYGFTRDDLARQQANKDNDKGIFKERMFLIRTKKR